MSPLDEVEARRDDLTVHLVVARRRRANATLGTPGLAEALQRASIFGMFTAPAL